jgi:glycosyltransferase involved in cell wall biosynthesis
MAARLAELLTKPVKAAAMGKLARARAVKKFDFKGLTEEFLEWIQELSTQ